MDRVRARVKDKRVLALVKAFLKAGVLTELGEYQDTWTGTPQGGISTPPTQWITGRLVTLRIRLGGGLAGGGAIAGCRDAVPDGDLLRPDEDVFDQKPQHSLAVFDRGGGGAVAWPGQGDFQVGGGVGGRAPG